MTAGCLRGKIPQRFFSLADKAQLAPDACFGTFDKGVPRVFVMQPIRLGGELGFLLTGKDEGGEKMAFYHRMGEVPKKRHTTFYKPNGELYREQVMGTKGFSGIQSILYHHNPPTQVRETRKCGCPAGICRAGGFKASAFSNLQSGARRRSDLWQEVSHGQQ